MTEHTAVARLDVIDGISSAVKHAAPAVIRRCRIVPFVPLSATAVIKCGVIEHHENRIVKVDIGIQNKVAVAKL